MTGKYTENPSKDRRPPRGGRGLKSQFNRKPHSRHLVAPLAGGRGLKLVYKTLLILHYFKSPPSRGAWIEIRET